MAKDLTIAPLVTLPVQSVFNQSVSGQIEVTSTESGLQPNPKPYKKDLFAGNRYARRKTENGPTLAGGHLGTVLKYLRIEDKLDQYQFVQRWEELVGKDVAARSKPEGLKKGVLFVSVQSSVWAQELSMRKAMILRRLQDMMKNTGAAVIQDLVFRVGRY